MLRALAAGALALASQAADFPPPPVLPAPAAAQLARSLAEARRHAAHVWRDTAPVNADGTVNGYVEIARGDRRKWEFRMRLNRRAIDRVLPPALGGYPVNYGFVPQTVSYDGDPFDVLVLGPPLAGGTVVRGEVVGVMHMEDEKGWDSKVVIAPLGADGRPAAALADEDRRRIADFFRRYKRGQPGQFATVPGWGAAAQGRAYVETAHAFFRRCRGRAGDCALAPPPSPPVR